jgi:NADH-quinone oxidoreductase subunit H
MVRNILIAIGIPLLAFTIGISLMMFKRKIAARIQRRYGPTFIQPLLDIFKLLSKQGNITHGVMYDLGPIIALAASMVVIFFIPIPGLKLLTGSADVIALLYIMVIGSLAMALGAGESANPNSSIGIARALTLMLGYDLPFVIVIISIVLKYHTTNLYAITQAQAGGHWAMWILPLSALVGIVVTYGALGEHPFDIAVAPHEVATGPMAEYGGKHLGLLMINHAFHIYIELALFVDLFMGGASNIFYFYAKMFIVFVVLIFFDEVLPRFRIDDAVRFYWRWPTILALIGLIIVLVK